MGEVDKKRKRGQRGKGTEGVEEGEVTESSHQLPAKEAWTGKRQQKKVATGTAKDGGE